jgi:hypothetical protein
MRNQSGRIKRLEQAASGCPGDFGPVIMYRVRARCEDRIPEPDPRCRRCGLIHDPPDATEAHPRITMCLVVIPPEDGIDDELGEVGWRPESDFWKGQWEP